MSEILPKSFKGILRIWNYYAIWEVNGIRKLSEGGKIGSDGSGYWIAGEIWIKTEITDTLADTALKYLTRDLR